MEKSVQPKAFHTSASTPTIHRWRGALTRKVPIIAVPPCLLQAGKDTRLGQTMQFCGTMAR
jgi:hypothetical protein